MLNTIKVPHKLKLAIWRYKADSAVAVEFPELDTLMELAVVDLDSVR
jgi:hypothetical protein